MDAPTVLLHDEDGRSLLCYLERSVTIDDQPYGLLQPVDAPAVIFAWKDNGEVPFPVESDAEISRLFPSAKAVLEEQNLTLLQTAITLTVEGDLPDIEDEVSEGNERNGTNHRHIESDGEIEEEEEAEEEAEEFQLLAIFYYKKQEYGVYTPLDPFLIVTRIEGDEPKLLSPEEFEKIEPRLEEALAELMERDELENAEDTNDAEDTED